MVAKLSSVMTILAALHDLRALMRGGRSDAEIAAAIGLIWQEREDRYSEIRTAETSRTKKVEMSYIGG